MAITGPTLVRVAKGLSTVTWSGFATNAETGAGITLGRSTDKSVHVLGPFAGSIAIDIQGSNDGSNWVALRDPLGNPLTGIAAATIKGILENTLYIRPISSAGSGGAAVSVIICAKDSGT